MYRFSIPLALVAVCLLGTCTVYAQERPFKGRGSGTLEHGHTPRLIAECYTTHLGRSVLIATLDEFEFAEGNIVPSALTIIGADDVLVASIHASFDPETGIIAGTMTFVGGNGRFADATGSTSLLIMFDDWTGMFGDPRFHVAIAGNIDY